MRPVAIVLVVAQLVFAGLWSRALAQDEQFTPAIKGHEEPVSKEERQQIETVMRDLLRSIHSRSYGAILSRISESYGIVNGGDSHYSKSEFEEELRDPNRDIHKDLYSMPDPYVNLHCKEMAGENEIAWPVSPYVYYEEFGEKYELEIYKTVYEKNGGKDVYYDVGPEEQRTRSGCLYLLFPFEFKRIDGILYWTAMPE